LFRLPAAGRDFDIQISNLLDERYTMIRREIRKIDTRIKTIKKATLELKQLSYGIQAIDRNAERILASVKMLEINVSDVKDLV
jgi:prefoldin subunit 5